MKEPINGYSLWETSHVQEEDRETADIKSMILQIIGKIGHLIADFLHLPPIIGSPKRRIKARD